LLLPLSEPVHKGLPNICFHYPSRWNASAPYSYY